MHQRDTGHRSHDVAATRPWDKRDKIQEHDTHGRHGCVGDSSPSAGGPGLACFASWHYFLLLYYLIGDFHFIWGGKIRAVESSRAMNFGGRRPLPGGRPEVGTAVPGRWQRRRAGAMLLLLRGCVTCTARGIYSYVSIYFTYTQLRGGQRQRRWLQYVGWFSLFYLKKKYVLKSQSFPSPKA